MPRTNNDGQIQRGGQAIQRSGGDRLADLIERKLPDIARALPKHLDPDRMARIATTAIRLNPKLGECAPVSFLGCLLISAQLGLEPNTPAGEGYLIPRRIHGQMECTWLTGYRGWMKLARQSGAVKSIWAEVVYRGDVFEYEKGEYPKLSHRPGDHDEDPDDITHAYAVADLGRDTRLSVVLTRRKINKAMAASQSGSKGPWGKHFDEMAKKTAIHRLSKLLPTSAELNTALGLDDAIEAGKGQAGAYTPEVVGALRNEGYIPTTGEPLEDDVDPNTGEVTPPPSEDALPPEEDALPLD